MSADVVQLAAYRKSGRAKVKAPAAEPAKQAYLSAAPGKVLLDLGNGAGLDLSPANARVWAERIAAMADVAEALEREGGRG